MACLLQTKSDEAISVQYEETTGREVGEVDHKRLGAHRDQDIDWISMRQNLISSEMDLKARDPRTGPR